MRTVGLWLMKKVYWWNWGDIILQEGEKKGKVTVTSRDNDEDYEVILTLLKNRIRNITIYEMDKNEEIVMLFQRGHDKEENVPDTMSVVTQEIV